MSARELKNLWDLIDAGNYKQALVKVNKELKKTPGNVYYISVQSYIACKLNKKDEAIQCANLAASSAPTNLTILALIQHVYLAYELDQASTALFESAARKSGDKDLLSLWQESMVESDNIKGLLKACTEMQKRYPSRNNSLNVVYVMAMALESGSVNDSEKKLFPMLCARHLEKLAPLENAQELYVQAYVLRAGGRLKELVEFLESIQCRDSDLLELKIMLVETLKEAKEWLKLHTECMNFLRAKSLDNWLHWKLGNEAAVELGYAAVKQTEQLIQEFDSRNSALARVHLASLLDTHNLTESVERFFSRFGDKRSCFADLEPYVISSKFHLPRWIKFLEAVKISATDSKSMNIQVNVQKFLYLSRPPESSQVSSLVERNVGLYFQSLPLLKNKDVKDYHPGDDFLLLSAISLLNSSDPLRIYKAVIILETAAQADEHQFSVRLWLVRLYLLLGCGNLARGHYDFLDIKSFQTDTLSPYLYTRISSISPAPITALRDINDQLSDFSPYIRKAFADGVYTQICGILELHQKLRYSLTKRLLDLEQIKVNRLLSDNANSSIVDSDNLNRLADNRDTEGMWTVGSLPMASLGPLPNAKWIRAQFLRERIIRRLLTGDPAVEELRSIISDPTKAALTDAELWSLDVICTLAESCQKKESSAGYKAVEEQVSLFKLTVYSVGTPWQWFHDAFTAIELCRVIGGYVGRLRASKQKFNAAGLDRVAKAAAKLVETVQGEAMAIKNSRNQRYTMFTAELKPWTESLGLSASVAEETIDGIGADQDQGLTLLRSVKMNLEAWKVPKERTTL